MWQMYKWIVLLLFWIAVLIVHWGFIQNDHLTEIDLEEMDEIEVHFDLFYFLTWLMGTLLIVMRIFEF